jgi:hypothetical protein
MRATVVYESMYGNTKQIAEAITEGLGDGARAVPVAAMVDEPITGLLVVGGPTHVWSMSRPNTRRAAAEAARKPGSGLVLQPSAESAGIREFVHGLVGDSRRAAAFDTRIQNVFSGRASRAIARALRRRGFESVASKTFLVTKNNALVAGELDRARAWGVELAARLGRSPVVDGANA